MTLRAKVLAQLRRHGIDPEPDDPPADLRERLNDCYLEEVRALRQRQASGEIPLRDYASHVEGLRQRFALLSLPLPVWCEPGS